MTSKVYNINLEHDNLRFEDYVMLRASQIGSIISLLSCVSNILLGLSFSITLTTLFGFIGYGILYIIFRRGKYTKLVFVIIPIFTIVYLNVLWFFNNRSNGPILYMLLVCYLFVQLIPPNSNALIIICIAFLNLSILFLFDFLSPMDELQYPSFFAKLFDNYIVVFFSLLLLITITGIFKKYYSRKLIQAQESDKLKSSFLSNLSHEIRTPLNSIIGFSSLLTEEYSIEDKAGFCQIIKDNGTQLCSLMDRLILVSKLESKNVKLVDEECDLKVLCIDLYEEYAPLFEQKSIDFDYSIRGRQTIRTDRRMLSIVLSELISNSLKFSNIGRVYLGVVNCSGRCTFFIKDYGIGIRDENQKKIFDHFIKITETSSRLIEGTGIGLSIVKELVKQLGGEVKMRSVYKKGSVFYFSLPVNNN